MKSLPSSVCHCRHGDVYWLECPLEPHSFALSGVLALTIHSLLGQAMNIVNLCTE